MLWYKDVNTIALDILRWFSGAEVNKCAAVTDSSCCAAEAAPAGLPPGRSRLHCGPLGTHGSMVFQ